MPQHAVDFINQEDQNGTSVTEVFGRILNLITERVVQTSEDSVLEITKIISDLSVLSEEQKEKLHSTINDMESGNRTLNPKEDFDSLVNTLKRISTSSENISEHLMPILIALQFQDRVRQELEGLKLCFSECFDLISKLHDIRISPDDAVTFWRDLANNFKNLESRAVVLKAAFGESYDSLECDVRDGQSTSKKDDVDDYFF